MIDALDALQRLKEGNRRFVSERPRAQAAATGTRRSSLVGGQAPFAVVIGCSDSRVPPEILFDQGLGDLFVIRVAGNVVSPVQIGSVEFAAEKLGTPLVVVMGHTQCGAVQATIDALQTPAAAPSGHLESIAELISPAVQPLLESELRHDRDALVHEAVRANVRAASDHLRRGSELLEALIARDRLLIVGAEYSLERGEVDFFDGIAGGES